MKVTDFRIGNLVEESKGHTHKIERLDESSTRIRHGIKLTEEWLIKFGFQREVLSDNSGYFYILELNDNKYCDLCFISGDKNGFIEVGLFPYEEWFRYQYVHELQNIYFAITGKELKQQ